MTDKEHLDAVNVITLRPILDVLIAELNRQSDEPASDAHASIASITNACLEGHWDLEQLAQAVALVVPVASPHVPSPKKTSPVTLKEYLLTAGTDDDGTDDDDLWSLTR